MASAGSMSGRGSKLKSAQDSHEETAIKLGVQPRGIPHRLKQQMWDAVTLVCLLGLMFGVAELQLRSAPAAAHGEVAHGHAADPAAAGCDTHAVKVPLAGADIHPHRELSGHGDTYVTDMQVALAICVLLVVVTIIFESIKEYLQHNVPMQLMDVLRAMFGELTVLGFIALFTCAAARALSAGESRARARARERRRGWVCKKEESERETEESQMQPVLHRLPPRRERDAEPAAPPPPAARRYMMLKAGVLQILSQRIYGDAEHMVHLFEDIHFMLFF
eukprot:5579659-Prymnesium_polylepis.1